MLTPLPAEVIAAGSRSCDDSREVGAEIFAGRERARGPARIKGNRPRPRAARKFRLLERRA